MATTTQTSGSNDLAQVMARAISDTRPSSMAERAERSDMVAVVLNPGQHSSVGTERFGPGQVILVDHKHAERLTTPRRGRSMPACRYLDEPEPDVRGNFPQPHGAGGYHPESKHHRDPAKAPKPKAGHGEKVIDGQIIETGVPSDEDRAEDTAARGGDPSSASLTSATGPTPGDQGPPPGSPAPQGAPLNPGAPQGGSQGGKTPAGQGGRKDEKKGPNQGGSSSGAARGGQTGDAGATVGDGGKSGS